MAWWTEISRLKSEKIRIKKVLKVIKNKDLNVGDKVFHNNKLKIISKIWINDFTRYNMESEENEFHVEIKVEFEGQEDEMYDLKDINFTKATKALFNERK